MVGCAEFSSFSPYPWEMFCPYKPPYYHLHLTCEHQNNLSPFPNPLPLKLLNLRWTSHPAKNFACTGRRSFPERPLNRKLHWIRWQKHFHCFLRGEYRELCFCEPRIGIFTWHETWNGCFLSCETYFAKQPWAADLWLLPVKREPCVFNCRELWFCSHHVKDELEYTWNSDCFIFSETWSGPLLPPIPPPFNHLQWNFVFCSSVKNIKARLPTSH